MSTPPPSPKDVVADLLDPVGVGEFLDTCWEQKAMVIPGRPDKFDWLRFDRSALHRLVAEHPGAEVMAQFHNSAREHTEMLIDAADAFTQFDQGRTICFRSIEDRVGTLVALKEAFCSYLNLGSGFFVNCYWSPRSGGFGMHLDRTSVLLLQLDGSKRWRFSETPGVPSPGRNFTDSPSARPLLTAAYPWLDAAGPLPFADDVPMAEATLHAGDALYLPAGTWHRAEAGDHSLALTVTFPHTRFGDLLVDALDAALDATPAWRAALPPVPEDEAPVHGLPRPVREFLTARIELLRGVVDGLAPESLAAAWREGLWQRPAAPLPEPRPAPDQVRAGTAFAVNGPLHSVDHPGLGGPQIRVYFAGRHLDLPASARALVDRLAGEERFVAGDVCGWSPDATDPWEWDDVRSALTVLWAAGAIIPPPAPPPGSVR